MLSVFDVKLSRKNNIGKQTIYGVGKKGDEADRCKNKQFYNETEIFLVYLHCIGNDNSIVGQNAEKALCSFICMVVLTLYKIL